MPDTYKPPQNMVDAARRGLELHAAGKAGDGLKPETVRTAKEIADGNNLTNEKIVEMAAWFARHAKTKPAGNPDGSPWMTAWLLWGGDAGKEWSTRMSDKLKNRLPRLLNRDFEPPPDGFYQMIPFGEFPNTMRVSSEDGKPKSVCVIQVIDEKAVQAICNRFAEESASGDFAGVLIDYDHASEDKDKSSEAAGWAIEASPRADGAYFRNRWTDEGDKAVAGGRFRFASPVFLPDECERIGERDGAILLRPLRVDRFALTNDHNMKTMRPLTNREPEVETAGAAGRKESEMDYKAELLAMLGLTAEATDEQIVEKVAAMKGELESVSAVKEERDQLEHRAVAAEAKVAEQDRLALETQVDSDLEKFKDVIVNRDEVKAELLVNRDGTLKVLAALKPAEVQEPLRNRRDATRPADFAAGDAGSDSDKLRERGALINKLQRENNWNYDQARAKAKEAKPELFKD